MNEYYVKNPDGTFKLVQEVIISKEEWNKIKAQITKSIQDFQNQITELQARLDKMNLAETQ